MTLTQHAEYRKRAASNKEHKISVKTDKARSYQPKSQCIPYLLYMNGILDIERTSQVYPSTIIISGQAVKPTSIITLNTVYLTYI